MRVLLLAKRNSIHTIRWASAFAERGHEVHLVSCHDGGSELSVLVNVHRIKIPPPFCYYLAARKIKKLIEVIKPDILHAHFASGYATLGRLSDFHPYIVSIWGSDVYEFPYRSPLHRWLLQKNLEAADRICSTSRAMAQHSEQFGVQRSILCITPFGIDLKAFPCRPIKEPHNNIVIGTVKALEDKYGIDVLIKAFAKSRRMIEQHDKELTNFMRLLIAGEGSKKDELMQLVIDEGVKDVTTFIGYVPHAKVPDVLEDLDIYVALSRSESFGVAVIEASARELPVIVSDVGGLPEVVENGVTGLVVKSESIDEAAHAIKTLVLDPQLRTRLGKAGRVFVQKHYEWDSNVGIVESIYEELVETDRTGEFKNTSHGSAKFNNV